MFAAAQREPADETGCCCGEWRLPTTLQANPSKHTSLTHCCLAKGVSNAPDTNTSTIRRICACL